MSTSVAVDVSAYMAGGKTAKKEPTEAEARFAANLKAAIVASGKTLTDLTIETKLNSGQISHYQTAGRMPSADRAGKLARAVWLSVEDLLYTESPEVVASKVKKALADGAPAEGGDWLAPTFDWRRAPRRADDAPPSEQGTASG